MIHKSRLRQFKGKKATVFLLFIGLILPVMFYVLAINIDYGHIILAREASADIADSVAMAGATGYEIDPTTTFPTGRFDLNKVVLSANGEYQASITAGSFPPVEHPDITPTLTLDPTSTKLTVSFHYHIKTFISQIFGINQNISGYTSRTVSICNPTLGQSCATPL